MKVLLWIVGLVLVLLLAAAACIRLGVYDVAADRAHHPAAQWLLQSTREASVERRARDVKVRLPYTTDEAMQFEAVVGFEDMCAACHAPPGRDPGVLAQGLNPPAPDLARAARQRTDAELFWVTKHGIRMTGMPAWGVTHSDDQLWPLIGLIRKFPDMHGDDYERLLADARTAGVEHHHDHDDDGGHSHDGAPTSDQEEHHEHHHH